VLEEIIDSPSGSENGLVRPESVKGSVLHVQGENSDTLSLGGHEEIKSEVLDEEVGVVLERLSVEGVQHGVSSSIGGGGASVSWKKGKEGRRKEGQRRRRARAQRIEEKYPVLPFRTSDSVLRKLAGRSFLPVYERRGVRSAPAKSETQRSG